MEDVKREDEQQQGDADVDADADVELEAELVPPPDQRPSQQQTQKTPNQVREPPSRKQQTLREFLPLMNDYAPIVF